MKKSVPANVAIRLRARYMLTGALMLALWGANVVALFRGGSTFNIIALVFTTLTFLPLSLVALWGGISGSEASTRRARNALLASGGLLMLIVAAEILRRAVFAAS